ncbi:hypothetical protein Ancab_006816 [Ancistrocladus abbreviatus]
MSWLSIPLPNPFKSLQFSADDDNDEIPSESKPTQLSDNAAASAAVLGGPGGVRDDLSVIGETIGRQLRGVAAFLAPPPSQRSQSPADDDDDDDDSPSRTFAGIRSDIAEIGGSFKSSLSLLSTNRAVSELSRFASNFLQLNDDSESNDGDEEESVAGVGITDVIVEFAKEISLQPECWTDFPISLDDGFSMSPIQTEHASVIEQLVPSLATLRDRFSDDMSDQQFWMIYFILVLPRLDEEDLLLLSTPEVVEARNTLLLMLQSKGNDSEKSQTDNSFQSNSEVNEAETKSNSLEEEKVVFAESSETSMKRGNKEHKTIEKWSEEQDSNSGSIHAQNQLKNMDDFPFSDLEDDDSDFSNRRSSSGPVEFAGASSCDGSNEWVRLNKNADTGHDKLRGQLKSRDKDSEEDETNDWLTVDDFDPDNFAA